MVKINLNQELLDKHIEKIDKKLKEKLNSIDTGTLSKITICCLNEISNNSKLWLN